MDINIVNNTNLKVTVNKSEDGKFSILIFDDKTRNDKPLGTVKPGSIIRIGSREWIVLGHGTETTAVITKDFVAQKVFDSNNGDYAKSDIRKWLNDKFYNEMKDTVGAGNIIMHTVYITADDGTGKGAFVKDNISLITTERYRRYRDHLPAYGNWWWTATRVNSNNPNYVQSVCCVDSCGILCWEKCDRYGGVRPFCILNSSIVNYEEV